MRRTVIVILLFMWALIVLGGAPDDDGDGVPNDQDCRPADGSLWAPPGQSVTDLTLSRAGSTAVLDWSTPADTGGDPGTERYDTFGTLDDATFGGQGIPNDEVVISSEVGVEKPHIEIFDIAAKRLTCDPHQLVHIGDSEHHDVEGAHAAGWQCILVAPEKQKTNGELTDLSKLLDVFPGRHV